MKQASLSADLPLNIEDYALIGDCITAALVGRVVQWAARNRFCGHFQDLLRFQPCPQLEMPAPRMLD